MRTDSFKEQKFPKHLYVENYGKGRGIPFLLFYLLLLFFPSRLIKTKKVTKKKKKIKSLDDFNMLVAKKFIDRNSFPRELLYSFDDSILRLELLSSPREMSVNKCFMSRSMRGAQILRAGKRVNNGILIILFYADLEVKDKKKNRRESKENLYGSLKIGDLKKTGGEKHLFRQKGKKLENLKNFERLGKKKKGIDHNKFCASE